MKRIPSSTALFIAAPALLAACAGAVPAGNPNDGGTRLDVLPLDFAIKQDLGNYLPPNCGDGNLTKDEACDDHNQDSGDGCSANCLEVEPGFSCIPAGQPCHRVARCGDGVTVLPELCDDNNKVAGDGCSATCKIEVGFKCEGSPSVCSPTTCGDGKTEGAESCEDGNAMPWDGCSAFCQNEPTCTATGCSSKCGDGIVLGEDCDDGNNIAGDGCSADCKPEPGFTCAQPDMDRMEVPVVYRDFRYHNPTDFEPSATGRDAELTGMVEPSLGADGKPVFTGIANSLVSSATTFNMWYHDVTGTNYTVARRLTLWKNADGAYVNRHGPNGEPWQRTITAYYCGSVGNEVNGEECTSKYNDPVSNPTDCDKYAAQGMTRLKCYVESNSYKATYLVEEMDGTPTFFPIDDVTFTPATERTSATIAPGYADNWIDEPGKPMHNFAFTSEIHYWFQYDASKTYKLDFTGDDDVWFFINGKLAVDLGGIHTPVAGSVTISAANAATFGLTDGKVYQIAAFHAERQTSGSSFRLTLSGFNPQPSECKPTCGDGILGIGEECDDGVNAGGYGKCGPECKLSEFCGDGIVQPEYEDCDREPLNGVECPNSCRILIIG